jgi:putative oxidoreductase
VVWIKWPVGWLYSNPGGGFEYPLFWLCAQATLVLCGDGAFALRRGFADFNRTDTIDKARA